MNSKFNDFFARIKTLDDSQMVQIVVNAEYELSKDFFPQIMVVSNPSTRKEIVGSFGDLIGSANDVLEDLATAKNDYIVRFQYGDDWNNNGFDDADNITDVANISIPWPALKNMTILWVCASSLTSIPNRFIINTDKLLLVTNATMAMTQEEKDFLVNVRSSIFADEPITISLCNKISLNTQEDVDDLCHNITKLSERYGKNTTFVDDFSNALRSQFECINEEQLKINRENRILTACLDILEDYIRKQLELAEVDIDRFNESIKKIEAERKNIEFSGKLVLNSTVENMYGEMKNRIIAAADRYSDDAQESIRARLSVSKTIEKDINNIAPYLKTVWANFEREIGKHMASEQEQIASVLEQQISSDCKKMVDIFKVNSVGENMNLSMASLFSSFTFVDMDEEKAKKDKMISKSLLIASIALAFVNPLWGLVGIAGTSAFTLSNNKNLDEAKERVLSALPNECNSIKRDIEKRIETVIEEAKKESCDNVWNVYSKVLDNLMAAILKYLDQIKAAKEKAATLQCVLTDDVFTARANFK